MLRALYVDLDSTLLGPGGSLLRNAEGEFTLLGARALEACARAGVEVVPYSGRRERSTWDAARIVGASAFIFEAGCGLWLDGEVHWLTGDLVPRDGLSISAQIERSGATALLLDRFRGRLAIHEPVDREHDIAQLFTGRLDAAQADALLESEGHGDLRLVDNGAVDGGGGERWYLLMPRAASKGAAVARHQWARGLAPEECLAVGDSREDATAAPYVGGFWFVANAVERDPSLRDVLAATPNARLAEASYGEGVYEAVLSTLMARDRTSAGRTPR